MTSNWIKLTVAATVLAAAPVVAALAAAPHSAADSDARGGAQSSSGKPFPGAASTVRRSATTAPRAAAASAGGQNALPDPAAIVGDYSPFGAERAAADDAAWQAIITGSPGSAPTPEDAALIGQIDIAEIIGSAYNGR